MDCYSIQQPLVAELAARAYRIRLRALPGAAIQGQGYIAQALVRADLAVAYGPALRFGPTCPEWDDRDRFLLSRGHFAIAYYAALTEAGVLPEQKSRPTVATTTGCQCQAWPVTPPA